MGSVRWKSLFDEGPLGLALVGRDHHFPWKSPTPVAVCRRKHTAEYSTRCSPLSLLVAALGWRWSRASCEVSEAPSALRANLTKVLGFSYCSHVPKLQA